MIEQRLYEQFRDIGRDIFDAGLTSKGGGGNTVRNVSACPFAGVCPREAFDVTPYALAVTEYLIPNIKLNVQFWEGAPIGINPPLTVEMKVSRTEPLDVEAAVSELGVVVPATRQEWAASSARFLESYPDHPVMLAVRALGEAWLERGDRGTRRRFRSHRRPLPRVRFAPRRKICTRFPSSRHSPSGLCAHPAF